MTEGPPPAPPLEVTIVSTARSVFSFWSLMFLGIASLLNVGLVVIALRFVLPVDSLTAAEGRQIKAAVLSAIEEHCPPKSVP